ncbi:activity-regulated cytoskeleton associated protein 2 [Osmia lignaria lignaria]|uniref:activity-regulated cytoskeleton associated protein 2 n=1 Tax=Osmia lignaria lignaria TaxID=1437193 RepID=UPI00402BE8CA
MRSGFTQLLRGEAQKWYRNAANKVCSWPNLQEQLRKFFVPAGEKRRLDQQIAGRKQGPDEPLRTFINEITTLMRRRGEHTEAELLDVIYFNMKPSFQLYINRAEIKEVSDLITRAETVAELMAAEQASKTKGEEQRAARTIA